MPDPILFALGFMVTVCVGVAVRLIGLMDLDDSPAMEHAATQPMAGEDLHTSRRKRQANVHIVKGDKK